MQESFLIDGETAVTADGDKSRRRVRSHKFLFQYSDKSQKHVQTQIAIETFSLRAETSKTNIVHCTSFRDQQPSTFNFRPKSRSVILYPSSSTYIPASPSSNSPPWSHPSSPSPSSSSRAIRSRSANPVKNLRCIAFSHVSSLHGVFFRPYQFTPRRKIYASFKLFSHEKRRWLWSTKAGTANGFFPGRDHTFPNVDGSRQSWGDLQALMFCYGSENLRLSCHPVSRARACLGYHERRIVAYISSSELSFQRYFFSKAGSGLNVLID